MSNEIDSYPAGNPQDSQKISASKTFLVKKGNTYRNSAPPIHVCNCIHLDHIYSMYLNYK